MARRNRTTNYKQEEIRKNSNYDPERCPTVVEELAARGCTLTEIAKAFNVSMKTIMNWKKHYSQFRKAYLRGKDRFDKEKVESALLKKALGYSWKEKRTKSVQLKEGRGKNQVKVPATEVTDYEKHEPPNVTAIIFYLVNRCMNDENPRWVNLKQTVEGTIKHGLTDEQEQLREIIKKLPKDDLERVAEVFDVSGPPYEKSDKKRALSEGS